MDLKWNCIRGRILQKDADPDPHPMRSSSFFISRPSTNYRQSWPPRCQKEFEKDYMEGMNKDVNQSQMEDPALSDAQKKRLKVTIY